jgi:hypothetical protein
MNYLIDKETGGLLTYEEAKAQGKLYRCCNTCIFRNTSRYGCSKANECYNGFSAYEPNEDIKNQEQIKL